MLATTNLKYNNSLLNYYVIVIAQNLKNSKKNFQLSIIQYCQFSQEVIISYFAKWYVSE